MPASSPCPTPPHRPSHPQFFLGSKLNVVLLVIPFAIISKAVGWGDGPTCALSMVALIPLAEVRLRPFGQDEVKVKREGENTLRRGL